MSEPAHGPSYADLQSEVKRLREGWDKMTGYSIALQRAIEAHCHGYEMPEHSLADCGHHAEMLIERGKYAIQSKAALRDLIKVVEGFFREGHEPIKRETDALVAARAVLAFSMDQSASHDKGSLSDAENAVRDALWEPDVESGRERCRYCKVLRAVNAQRDRSA